MHSIGAASSQSGVNIETIRYYEREGVVPKADRSASGRRLYTDKEIVRLRFVKRCRELGFPILEIKSLLGLSAGETTSCILARSIANQQLISVREKVADLRRMEGALVDLIALCADERSDCPMLGDLFAS